MKNDHNQFLPVLRSERQRQDPNPVYSAFMEMRVSETFSRREVRDCVLTGYIGLVKQIDDHLGRLFVFLEKAGRMDDEKPRLQLRKIWQAPVRLLIE